MIDIIIPAYNAHDTIMDTLYSISYQTYIDKCNVYIVNDCSDKDYSFFIDFFKKFINIKELKMKKNGGPGLARQYGIDHSNSEYIVFIDSDDVFNNPFAIERLFNTIEMHKSDLVISAFLEETNNGYVKKYRDSTWLHGKIYKRSFLDKNKICFNSYRENEDVGFNELVILCDAEIYYIDDFTYIWKNNRNSITRKYEKSFLVTGLNGYVKNITWAIEEASKRKHNIKRLSELALSALVYVYHVYLEYNNEEEFNDILLSTKELVKLSNKYKVDEEKRIDIIENQYKMYYSKRTRKFLVDPIITFRDFVKMLGGGNI